MRSFVPVSWVLNNSVPVPDKIRLGKSLFPELFRVIKNTKFMEAHRDILTFPTVGEIVYSSRTAVNHPLVGMNRVGICIGE